MRTALDADLVRSIYDKNAEHYDRLHGLLTLHSDQRGRELLVREAVTEGAAVLDAGRNGQHVFSRGGAKGSVVVLDAGEGMREVGRERARTAGLAERMEFRTGDILHLPFADSAFGA